MIMASMRNWINGNDLDLDLDNNSKNEERKEEKKNKKLTEKIVDTWKDNKKTDRVVVVHCKAGKGRSGTVACSYLIAECGWTPEQAIARFTERRMRPRMGPGVSIPSQVRTIGYVERWARQGRKVYVDRPVEILEVHVWGLRNGVKLAVEGYADEGKKIQVLHTFSKKERHVVDGDPPGGAGVMDMVYDMAGYGTANPVPAVPEQEVLDEARASDVQKNEVDPTPTPPDRTGTPSSSKSVKAKMNKRASTLISKVSRSASKAGNGPGRKSSPTTELDTKSASATTTTNTAPVAAESSSTSSPSPSSSTSLTPLESKLKEQAQQNSTTMPADEPGGRAVIFKPHAAPVRVPTSDVNITIERRNRAPRSVGLVMVTAVAHVWFNAFFEGNGPEQGGRADQSGVFEIDWDKLDGIKGSSQKGTRAADRIAVVWRFAGTGGDEAEEEGKKKKQEEGGEAEGEGEGEGEGKVGEGKQEAQGEVINQPSIDSPVPQMRPADWKGGSLQDPDAERRLGLRVQSPDSADVSQASTSSLRNEVVGEAEDELELRSVRSDVSGGGSGEAGELSAYKNKLPSPEGGGR